MRLAELSVNVRWTCRTWPPETATAPGAQPGREFIHSLYDAADLLIGRLQIQDVVWGIGGRV